VKSLNRLVIGFLSFLVIGSISADEPGIAEEAGKQLFRAAASGDVNQVLQAGTSNLTGKAQTMAEGTLLSLFPTAEVEITWNDEQELEGSLLILAPLLESADNTELMFMQASASQFDRRTTVNLGLGARHLAMGDKLLMGVNAFYDHEFPFDHQRVSVGAELRTTIWEINANYYWGTSGWKLGRAGAASQERAMDGFDIEYGMPLPYLPRTKIYGTYFRWSSSPGTKGDNGWQGSLESELFDGVNFKMGHRYYSDMNDEVFAAIEVDVVDLLTTNASDKPFVSNVAWELASMKEERYAKVRRENLIRKEKRTVDANFVVTVSGF